MLTELAYKNILLGYISEKELNIWLEKNPVPDIWCRDGGKYSYAYTEMPIGKIFTWWRKNILRWKI
jgi:hypothetical protein